MRIPNFNNHLDIDCRFVVECIFSDCTVTTEACVVLVKKLVTITLAVVSTPCELCPDFYSSGMSCYRNILDLLDLPERWRWLSFTVTVLPVVEYNSLPLSRVHFGV